MRMRAVWSGVAGVATAAALVACPDFGSLQGTDEATEAGSGGPTIEGGATDGDSAVTDGAAAIDAGCGPGQLQTADAACVGACSGKACGPHTRCGADGVTCECVTGYTKTLPGDCVWSGGPLDPELAASPPIWTIADDAGMKYAPDAGGGALVDPGQVTFGNGCGKGSIAQTFAMPLVSEAEPLALDLSASNPEYMKGDPVFEYSTYYSLGASRVPLAVGQPFTRTRTCLGELAFGGSVGLRLFRQCGRVVIDHAGFVAEPACPLPGKVGNGDFESVAPATAWSAFFGASVATDGPSVRGILPSATQCDTPTLRGGAASVTRAGGQALVFRLEGPVRPSLRVGLGTTTSDTTFIAELNGTNAVIDARVCVPAWARGMAWPLTFWVPKVGDCSVDRIGTLKVDDVRLEDDPACAGSGFIFGGDFEVGASGARYGYMGEGTPLEIKPNGVGGNHAVAFEAHGYPAAVTRTAILAVSLPDVPHVALKFHYTTGGSGNDTRAWTFEIPGGGGTLAQGSIDYVQCIAPVAGGGPALLKFNAYSPDDYSLTDLAVDNVRFEVDPTACP